MDSLKKITRFTQTVILQSFYQRRGMEKNTTHRMYFILPGKKVPKDPGPVSLKTLKIPELITVLPVAMHCLKAIPNLKAVVAGQVFMTPSAREVLFTHPIIHMECKEQKCNAVVVNHI